MPRDFVPRRDAEFLTFTANFSAKISAPPGPAAYGLSVEQAAHYALTQEAFAAAYDIATAPGTGTIVSVRAKNDAREALEAETRMLARQIRCHAPVTDEMRAELGLSVSGASRIRRKRVPAPGTAPVIIIDSVKGMVVNLRLLDAESGRTRRPRDVTGATVLSFVGEEPPASRLKWSRLAQTSRTRVSVPVSAARGEKMWLTASWMNGRSENGPWASAVSTLTLGGLALIELKRAA